MLPLGGFAIMRAGTSEDAEAGIRSRHPGVQAFTPTSRVRDWRIDINLLDLGRTFVIATETSGFSVSVFDDGLARFYLPMRRGATLRRRGEVREMKSGAPAFVPGGEYSSVFDDGYRGLLASFRQELVAEALANFCTPAPQLKGLGGVGLDRLTIQLLSLVRAMDHEPAQIVDQRRFRQAHEELLLLHLAQALAAPVASHESGAPRRHLNAAMDYIHAHLFDEIGPMAVAAAAGCSLRNLQLLFRRESGRTITETIRDLRLQAAHRRFRRGRGEESITSVALDCGFSHLSDFARHYRARFGERPSDTMGLSRMARQ